MKEFSYDKSMLKIQKLVSEIQSGDIGLDKLSTKIAEASSLIKLCQEKLRNIEEEVNQLQEQSE